MYYSLLQQKEELLALVQRFANTECNKNIFDPGKFAEWYEKLAQRKAGEMNYSMPGAFYTYLMIMLTPCQGVNEYS